MRKIHKNKITIVWLRDSTTDRGSKASWLGTPTPLWVRHEDMSPVEIFVIEDGDPKPEPQDGFAYGGGFIG